MFESIGPVWDGNEVWLVVAGRRDVRRLPGLVRDDVLGLLPRAAARSLLPRSSACVSFEWRAKGESRAGGGSGSGPTRSAASAPRSSGASPSRPFCTGSRSTRAATSPASFCDLFNLYTVLGGIPSSLLFAFHGATYLTLRTTGDLCERAAPRRAADRSRRGVVVAGFLAWTVAVAVDRNDKDVFPPLVPALLGIAALSRRGAVHDASPKRLAFALTGVGNLALVATAVHEPLPARDGLEHRFRATASRSTNAVLQPLHAGGDERRRPHLPPGHPPLSGLDLPRLPRADRWGGAGFRRAAGGPAPTH